MGSKVAVDEFMEERIRAREELEAKYDKPCPDCGAKMKGVPWENMVCPVCGVWTLPDLFHQDAPTSVRERGKVLAKEIARDLIKKKNLFQEG